MLLGDLVSKFSDETFAAAALLNLNDLSLTVRAQKAAELEGLTLGEFARRAVITFSGNASDEEWVTVIGHMGRSLEPGIVLLHRSLVWMTDQALANGGPE